MSESGCFRFRFRVPENWGDEFSAAVWTAGFLGLHGSVSGDPERMDCYFRTAEGPSLEARWAERRVELVSCARVAEVDWAGRYRDAAEPFDVGDGYRVDPREPTRRAGVERAAGRRLLRIPASRAFGTGSHESTRLAVELLESLDLSDRRVLDFGSGSGILSMVALDRGARLVVGVDHDAESVFCSQANGDLNNLRPALCAGSIDSLDAVGGFEVIVVNILPARVLHHMEALSGWIVPGGRLVYSGALVSQADEVEAKLVESDFEIMARSRDREWIAFEARMGVGP